MFLLVLVCFRVFPPLFLFNQRKVLKIKKPHMISESYTINQGLPRMLYKCWFYKDLNNLYRFMLSLQAQYKGD